jgi:RNA polymerase sigma-70 factor (ECF subfamily)
MSLLERATRGNHEAWEQIVFLYAPLVERWCRQRSLTEAVVREIGQDVFLKLFENLWKFRKDKPEHGFRKWLWTVTQHTVLDHLRKSRREPRCLGGSAAQSIINGYPEEPPHPDSGEAGDPMPPDERAILLRRCLELVRSEFQPHTFEAFWEITVNGRAPSDVARALGLKSVGAAYTAKSRVLRRLRELLEPLGEDMPIPEAGVGGWGP